MIGKLITPLAALLAAQVALGQEGAAVTAHVNLSGMAAGVVASAREARQALTRGDRGAALDRINEASALARNVEEAAQGAGLGSGGKLLVPMASEVETVSVYQPVKRGKDGKLTAKRMKRETSVREVTGQVTSTSLDVRAARTHLDAARAALERGDTAAGDAALAAVETSVVTEAGTLYLPLLKARQNLELARARVLEGKYKHARMPLKSAAQALEQYSNMKENPRALEAKSLATEVSAFAERINDERGRALEEIQLWLETVNAWREAKIE